MKIDFAYGYIGSFKLSKAKGLDMSFNIYYDYKKSDENSLTFIDKIKNFFISLFKKISSKSQVEKKSEFSSSYF